MEELQQNYVNGLREAADWFDANPDLIPNQPLYLMIFRWNLTGDRMEWAQLYAAKMPRPVDKDYDGDNFSLKSHFGPHQFSIEFAREDVCQRVVTGTREVTEEVLDPDVVADIPRVTITRTEDVVEWVCPPSLLGVASDADQ